MQLRTYVLSDSIEVIERLVRYITDTPHFCLSGFNLNAIAGLREMSSQEIDMVFLDVDLEAFDVFSLSSMMNPSVIRIYVASDESSSTEAFKNGALGYLMKSATFENFTRCVHPILSVLGKRQKLCSFDEPYIYINDGTKGKLLKLNIRAIDYIESNNNHIIINCSGEAYHVYFTLKDALKQLPVETFLRIHKSFVVNHNRIACIDGNLVVLADKTILTLGSSYKEAFFEKISPHLIKNSKSEVIAYKRR